MKCIHPTDSLLQISSDVIAVKLVAVLYREGLINHTVYRQVTACLLYTSDAADE